MKPIRDALEKERPQMVNIGLVQMAAEPLNLRANLFEAERCIARVAQDGAQIVVLPEMFNVGFSTQETLALVAEDLDGPSVTWLKDQALKYGIYILTSVYEKLAGRFYNTMVMVGKDRSLQIYRKRNPTCQERLVWERYDAPGPGIFETPFGRIGGAICFDSFATETFEGFKRSGVALVVIVALWGRILPMRRHPDSFVFHRLLRRQSYLASEVVPRRYATVLKVPVVYVNQSGRIALPIAHPRFYPFSDWADAAYAFDGNSNICGPSGEKLISSGDLREPFCAVQAVEIKPQSRRPPISRVDIPPAYLDPNYYFVEPPCLFKVYQQMCFTGFKTQYETMRLQHGVS